METIFIQGAAAYIVLIMRSALFLVMVGRGITRLALLRRSSGQGMVEYALLLMLISGIVIASLLTLGDQIQNALSYVRAAIDDPINCAKPVQDPDKCKPPK